MNILEKIKKMRKLALFAALTVCVLLAALIYYFVDVPSEDNLPPQTVGQTTPKPETPSEPLAPTTAPPEKPAPEPEPPQNTTPSSESTVTTPPPAVKPAVSVGQVKFNIVLTEILGSGFTRTVTAQLTNSYFLHT